MFYQLRGRSVNAALQAAPHGAERRKHLSEYCLWIWCKGGRTEEHLAGALGHGSGLWLCGYRDKSPSPYAGHSMGTQRGGEGWAACDAGSRDCRAWGHSSNKLNGEYLKMTLVYCPDQVSGKNIGRLNKETGCFSR